MVGYKVLAQDDGEFESWSFMNHGRLARGIKWRAHSPTFPSLHLRHNSFSNPSVALPTSQLILQPLRHFTYVTIHSPTLPLLYLRQSSFSNPSFTSSTPQIILQPFLHFTYATDHSPTLLLLHLRHSSFSNPSFASPTSQDPHLIHLASRPCMNTNKDNIRWVSATSGDSTLSIYCSVLNVDSHRDSVSALRPCL